MKRVRSVEEHRLTAAFDALCETLQQPQYAERIEKPLAFWALPNDRRLPMALLGLPLKTLIGSKFEDLAETPGIGRKKINSLIKLLARATKQQPPGLEKVVPIESHNGSKEGGSKGGGLKGSGSKGGGSKELASGFDPATISELVWEEWRNTVQKFGIGHEPLGRLAPTLERLPTVIWRTPLATYCDYTIAEIRELKTHGQKRINSILEVFYGVHSLLRDTPVDGYLRMRLTPAFILPIEKWARETIYHRRNPSPQDLKEHVIDPLIAQVRVDAGGVVSRLCEERIGLRGNPARVQFQAKRLGVTRARVYQLFEMCADVMSVRWPEGAGLLTELKGHLEKSVPDHPWDRFLNTLELLYPTGGGLSDEETESTEMARSGSVARFDSPVEGTKNPTRGAR